MIIFKIVPESCTKSFLQKKKNGYGRIFGEADLYMFPNKKKSFKWC